MPNPPRALFPGLRGGSESLSAARVVNTSGNQRAKSVLVLGVGAFAHSTGQILKEAGADVSTYLTRSYAHYAPSIVGRVYRPDQVASPAQLVNEHGIRLVVPMSIDWALAPWADQLLSSGVSIFCPTGAAMQIERERDFARRLCQEFKIPFPEAHVARNRLEAEAILERHPHPFVLKNPLCSPTSPIHTILCETLSDTRSWLKSIDYAEGVFMQEYVGRCEAGHIALISAGEVYSLVTNQEYKRAFAGDLGVVAGAPLGGLVERDPEDKYGLARELLHPLRPWFKQVDFHGPIQVTAVRRNNKWHVIEYNIRIGVTSGAMLLRMLSDPLEVLLRTGANQPLSIRFAENPRFGCSLTLAGYGYPYVQIRGPQVPVEVTAPIDCDVWWNEVACDNDGALRSTGHRICDVVAFGDTLPDAIQKAYSNIRKVRSLGSYYRPDVG
ncbi:MAG TPA: phosphoribosylglycinamide synthetase C domain-containing protein, partial [Patescibacteria group bacterium]|nr:phosphoribosylglycinamide synthetase C domain-containing protein [Patescibacteria group bacterium]